MSDKNTPESDEFNRRVKKQQQNYLRVIIVGMIVSCVPFIILCVNISKMFPDDPNFLIIAIAISVISIIGTTILLINIYRKITNCDNSNEEDLHDFNTATVIENNLWTSYAATCFAGGNGSSENPYQIATPAQLALLAKDKTFADGDYHFILLNDLDMGEHYWVSIGGDKSHFVGTIDGDGKMISHIFSFPDGNSNHGLIYHAKKCVIKNLTINKCVFAASTARVGSLIGDAEEAEVTLDNCIVRSSIIMTKMNYALGLIGYFKNAKLSGKKTILKSSTIITKACGYEGRTCAAGYRYPYTETSTNGCGSPRPGTIKSAYKKQNKMMAEVLAYQNNLKI